MKDLKIAVAGTGYVGLSIATLLSQHHQVTAVDVIPEKVDMLNRKQSPIQDEYIEKYLSEKALNLTATLDGAKAYSDADFVVIAAPTNYDPVKNYFDTHHIEDVIDLVPAAAAPYTMFTDATSDSPCTKLPPTSGSLLAKYSGISFCGVIGYPAKNLQPALTAASAIASQPFINTLAIIFLPPYL